MKLSLLVVTPGKMEGKTLDIKLSQFIIGRDPQCHLRPASPLISKRHCAILVKDDRVFIHDFDSTNGTLVNDQPIEGEYELHHDDRLKVGPLLFAVRMEPDAPAKSATPAPATRPAAQAGKTPPPGTRPAGSVPATKQPAAKPTPGAAKQPAPATEAPAPAAEAPAPKPAAASASGSSDDDDVMAMLMGMADDSTGGEVSRGPDGVPDGSTVMDLKLPDTLANQPVKDDKKKEQKKADADTRTAAARILEQMTRRPRT